MARGDAPSRTVQTATGIGAIGVYYFEKSTFGAVFELWSAA